MKKIDKIKIFEEKNFTKLFDKGLVSYEEPNTSLYRMKHEIKLGIKEDLDFTYNYNSLGLRSDEFKKEHQGKHILFAGCSETEGIGTKLDNLWAYRVYKKIEDVEKCSGFFNIGVRALTIDLIIGQIFSYIEEYGKPDTLFINYPDFYRYYKWDSEKEHWVARAGIVSGIGYNPMDKFYLKDFKSAVINENNYILIKDLIDESIIQKSLVANSSYFEPEHMYEDKYYESVIQGFKYFELMEKFCRILKIDLFWGTWDRYSSDSIQNSNLFEDYVNIGKIKSFYKWADESGYTTKSLSSRDFGHCGPSYHEYWAEQMVEAYMEKLKNK
jgi:hypothetical protein